MLQSAHDAAAEMVANADAESTRLVSEARAESGRLLAEATEVNEQAHSRADTLLAERTAEAEAAAASLQERTEQQVAAALDKVRPTPRSRPNGPGPRRVMVEEAQQLRARVLADLSRRRKVLHAQFEQLRAGRSASPRRSPRCGTPSTPSPRTCSTPRTRPDWPPRWLAGRWPAGATTRPPRSWRPPCWPRKRPRTTTRPAATAARVRWSPPCRTDRPRCRSRPRAAPRRRRSKRSTPCSPSCEPPRGTRARPEQPPPRLPPGRPWRRWPPPRPPRPPRPNRRWTGTKPSGTGREKRLRRDPPRPGTHWPCSVTNWWRPSSPACPVD